MPPEIASSSTASQTVAPLGHGIPSRGSTYKAAVWMGPGRLEVTEKAIPVPGPGKVLLRVCVAGICGTDLHILAGKHPDARPPLVPGHEFAGVVAAVGQGAEKTLAGQRMGCDSYISCGKCGYCREGRPQLCENGPCEMGINVDGGWAEYVVVPTGNLYPLPDCVSFLEAGAGCILNCPMAAIEAVWVRRGETVLIIGDGPSSLVMVQLALIRGASRVIVAGHRERRLALAREFGACLTVNTNTQDLKEALKGLPEAPQVVIDAVGSSESFALALVLAGKEARVHLFGLPEGPLNELPLDILLFKELKIVSSTGDPSLWPKAMELMCQGQLRVAPIVTHVFPIDKAPEAIAYVRERRKEIIKAVFQMDASG